MPNAPPVAAPAMLLSVRTKEAFKTALAMTIAFAIALSLDWEQPVWAGIAVAVISLATVGQSLNKAAMRMLGTLVAAVVALVVVALFPQDRLAFIAILSVYFGVCAYLMSGSRYQYFWQVAGFVCLIIAFAAEPLAGNGFEIAVLRAQETGLGVVVYSVVAVLLWPTSSRAEFDAAAQSLLATQHRLYQDCLVAIGAESREAEAIGPARTDILQKQTQFGLMLAAAETDTEEVMRLRRQWRRFQTLSVRLTEAMERWRATHPELQALDLHHLFPGLAMFVEELDDRFAQMKRVLAGQPPSQDPKAVDLAPSAPDISATPHFHRAALLVAERRLVEIDRLTRAQLETLSDIKGFGRAASSEPEAIALLPRLVPDADRLADALRVTAVLWLAILAWILVEGLPGGPALIVLAGALAMIKATLPQIPVTAMFAPAAMGAVVGGVAAIGIMPQLSGFAGLSILVFVATFLIYYGFHTPKQALGRLFGIMLFLILTNISNPQDYDIPLLAESALMFPLIFALLLTVACLAGSPRPEKAMLRRLGRFFRSSQYLLSTMRVGPVSLIDRLLLAFHRHEITTLPGKLTAWAAHVDTGALPGTTPDRVQALVTSLQGLSVRLLELLDARHQPLADDLAQELLSDVRNWRLKGQAAFGRLAADPAAADHDAFQASLADTLAGLEAHLRQAITETAAADVETRDLHMENTYRLLGAYRALSEAMIDYAGRAGDIDWVPWREARF